MRLRAHDPFRSLFVFLFCVLLRSCQAFKNDATELLFSHVSPPVPVPEPEAAQAQAQGNVSLNRARSGGRGTGTGTGTGAQDRGDRSQIGCRELRSTKYISDGHCTSINPIKELVCAGECLPTRMLENWIGGGSHGRKFWARGDGNHDWRCVNDKTRTQRIRLECQDGSARTYKITVVTSCKCKRYSRQHNESGAKFEGPAVLPPQLLRKHKSKSKRRPGKKRLRENWHEPEP